MKRLMLAIIFPTLALAEQARAEVTQADINLVLPRFAGYWTYEGPCEKQNVNGKCWFILEIKKELYGDKQYFSYGMQRAIPAKAEVLEKACGDFNYNTGFTVSNLPNVGICIKLDDKNDKAELYYPTGMTEHGRFKLVRSTKQEWARRNKAEDDSLIDSNGR